MSEIYTPEPVYTPSPTKQGEGSKDWMAIVALVLGILSLCGWLIPLCGFPLTVAGIILGILGMKSTKRTLAIVGLVLCGLALLATVINSILGAAFALSDPSMYQDLLNQLQN